jgi:antitoxin (DNA-binding transcriptional repressor) of toxin-antitoxin stability system
VTSLAVKDLKRPRELRAMLEREREVFVTKDGQPFAILVGVDADGAEDTLREVRRALFSAAVLRARRRARGAPLAEKELAAEIRAVRKARSLGVPRPASPLTASPWSAPRR